jgi:hypothetical protein
MTKTDVIFRKWSNGDVIALFPGLAFNPNTAAYCSSYEHVGQHGAASVDLTATTCPAKPDEYAGLKAELESRGYSLRVVKRFTQAHHHQRSVQ